MNSLSARLSAALLLIILLMGGAFFVFDRLNTRLFYEELTQRLNAPIAMYVTGQRLLLRDGQPDLASLKELAEHAMVINPSLEIYLLDESGFIVGHALPADSVRRARVDLAPLRAFIAEGARLPIRGDDPRNPDDRKIFSAAELRINDRTAGFLYVVLGGQKYEALANDLGSLYVGRISVIAVLVIVLAAGTIGFLVFGLLTRRLKRLSRDVARLSDAPPNGGAGIDIEARDDGDEIDRLTATFEAMSHRIREQFDQLRENDRLRRELVTNISHDLRTPLSAMQGYLDTLLIKDDRLSDEDRRRYLEIARQHTLRLGVLVGDLFELAKLDSASVTPSPEAFSVLELVHDIALEFRIEAERRDIRLSVERNVGPALTLGDIGLIQRVLENLVRNAVNFTPKGGEVVLSITERPQSVAVAVTDTGPGIPEEDIPHIFDRFFKAPKGDESRSDSSGLGLAIVKRILDLHGSRITVTSRVSAGTRFEFELPRYDEAA